MIYKSGFLAKETDKSLAERLESFRVNHKNQAERLRTWHNEEEWVEGLVEVREELAARRNFRRR